MLVSITRLGMRPAEQRVEEANWRRRRSACRSRGAVGLGDGALREGCASGRPFDPSRRLRTGPAGLLRVSGRGDGISFPQCERPTTLAGDPVEARLFRAVSKDQGEWIRNTLSPSKKKKVLRTFRIDNCHVTSYR
jgi:hypothetical protein